MREKRFKTRSVEETLALGERIAAMLHPPLLVILRGEVGAGKTTLVKGIAAALGAAAEDEVTSPTFTIVHEYVGVSVRLFHLDLYRLETEEQIAVLGINEMASYPDSLLLVEWGERFESIVNRSAGEIYMEARRGRRARPDCASERVGPATRRGRRSAPSRGPCSDRWRTLRRPWSRTPSAARWLPDRQRGPPATSARFPGRAA